jgi:hypothetical protein
MNHPTVSRHKSHLGTADLAFLLPNLGIELHCCQLVSHSVEWNHAIFQATAARVRAGFVEYLLVFLLCAASDSSLLHDHLLNLLLVCFD